ncbi:hypothetical protein TWF718_009145 [Orbilia javanica]|uniref:Uncharacterized protein n=1 Tax=Orbilia javanica TaxID=47235 RepID=A0AAN8MVL0_9PEZI
MINHPRTAHKKPNKPWDPRLQLDPNPSKQPDTMSAIDSTNPDDESDLSSDFFAPSEHFSINYYHGLPSKPPLLATTKPQPEISPTGFPAYSVSKIIHAISGKHPIVSIWDSGVSDEILGVLERMDRNWTSLEVVHIPAATDPSLGPAIVWIGVEPRTLSYRKAAITALKCQEVINASGIPDCSVDMRSSVVTGSGRGVRFIDLFKKRDWLREVTDVTYVTPIHFIMEVLHSTTMFQNAHLDVNLN